jgi:hypothetical protein
VTPEAAAERIKALEHFLRAKGRRLSEMALVVSPYTLPTGSLDKIKRYRDAGAGEVVMLLPISESPEQVRAAVEWLGEKLVEPAARL